MKIGILCSGRVEHVPGTGFLKESCHVMPGAGNINKAGVIEWFSKINSAAG